MNDIHLRILWTKTGDTVPYRRQLDLSVEYPTISDTTAIQDALLQLPDQGSVYTIRIKDEFAEPPPEVIIVERINQLATEAEKKSQAEKAQTEKARVEKAHHDREIIEKWLAGDKDLVVNGYVEYQLHIDCPADLREKVREKNTKIQHVADECRARADECRARADEARKIRRHRQNAEIANWADRRGSNRLREQIRQGLTGWPLYLHERMAIDLPEGVELDNDGTDLAEVANPTERQLAVVCELAEVAVELELVDTLSDAFKIIEIRQIKLDPDDGFNCYDDLPEDCTHTYVIMRGYRPGGENFDTKDIRIRV